MTSNKTALLTGVTSGFGEVIVRHLAQSGYSVIIVARSESTANALKTTLLAINPSVTVEAVLCDLSSLKSIRSACELIQTKHNQIDLMVLNAGLWNFEFRETEDGIEETLQVNLIAPVLMFELLKNTIPADGNSKVIFTASGLHQGTVQFDDLEFRNNFSGFKAYRQSKLGVILITRLLAKTSQYDGISFYCVHPGIVKTQLGKNAGWFSRTVFWLIGKSSEKGAKTHLHLIDTPSSKLVSGEYYANSKLTQTTKESNDLDTAKKLMEVIESKLATANVPVGDEKSRLDS